MGSRRRNQKSEGGKTWNGRLNDLSEYLKTDLVISAAGRVPPRPRKNFRRVGWRFVGGLALILPISHLLALLQTMISSRDRRARLQTNGALVVKILKNLNWWQATQLLLRWIWNYILINLIGWQNAGTSVFNPVLSATWTPCILWCPTMLKRVKDKCLS